MRNVHLQVDRRPLIAAATFALLSLAACDPAPVPDDPATAEAFLRVNASAGIDASVRVAPSRIHLLPGVLAEADGTLSPRGCAAGTSTATAAGRATA